MFKPQMHLEWPESESCSPTALYQCLALVARPNVVASHAGRRDGAAPPPVRSAPALSFGRPLSPSASRLNFGSIPSP